MSLFLFKRFLTLIATLIGASVIVFLVLEILPGNAAQMLMGPDAAPEAVAALAAKLGLDQPAWSRYWHWIGGLLTGELGDSYAYSSPVLDLILERLALTVPLALLAMAFTTVLALAVGVTAAARHNKLGDVGLMGLTQVGIAIPNFWFAILLILVFSVQLQWFSAGGFEGWGEGILSGLKSLLLPALSLAVVQAAILARITRSAVLEVMREDFVRTARAKGVSQRAVLWGHVLRNAMIPVVTVMGMQFSELLAGAKRGWVEEAIMRLTDFTMAFPAILSAIMMTAVFGAGIVNAIIAIGIYNIPTFARITRASANAIWSREYVAAARACGKGAFAITMQHV
ncbi:MAG: ABC transporter permease subunit, partial [Variovorax sp.]